MGAEQKDRPIQTDGKLPQDYQWIWPPVVDISALGPTKRLVTLFESQEGQQLKAILCGADQQIPKHLIKRTQKALDLIRVTSDQFTETDILILRSLRDASYNWFMNNHWSIQPSEPENSEDSRYYNLLLPASLLNTLSKTAISGRIKDVSNETLLRLCDKAYNFGLKYVSYDYLSRLALKIDGLKNTHSRGNDPQPAYSYDLNDWMQSPRPAIDDIQLSAQDILELAYENTVNYFQPYNLAAGFYFMKSVIIGVMQEWHNQRLGIIAMIPPISWQESDNQSTPYNFEDNSTLYKGNMHTNNKRYPFQKYVAHYLRRVAANTQQGR